VPVGGLGGCASGGAVALQSAEIIRVAEFHTQLLKDCPVALLALGPERLREVALEVSSG